MSGGELTAGGSRVAVLPSRRAWGCAWQEGTITAVQLYVHDYTRVRAEPAAGSTSPSRHTAHGNVNDTGTVGEPSNISSQQYQLIKSYTRLGVFLIEVTGIICILSAHPSASTPLYALVLSRHSNMAGSRHTNSCTACTALPSSGKRPAGRGNDDGMRRLLLPRLASRPNARPSSPHRMPQLRLQRCDVPKHQAEALLHP